MTNSPKPFVSFVVLRTMPKLTNGYGEIVTSVTLPVVYANPFSGIMGLDSIARKEPKWVPRQRRNSRFPKMS